MKGFFIPSTDMEIIDLSQEIYTAMPVHHTQPDVRISIHATHEEWWRIPPGKNPTPSVQKIEMSEHTGTHVDAQSHMGKSYAHQSIDQMPLSTFYTRGVCLDLSYKGPNELIEVADLENAKNVAKVEILPGDTVLLYTDHYRKHFNTPLWAENPGLSTKATQWLGELKIAAFGVESMAPGVKGVSNKEVHLVCGEMGFTHYENLTNLHQLLNREPFRFIGFPLKIRGGTGSPVRAVAIFE